MSSSYHAIQPVPAQDPHNPANAWLPPQPIHPPTGTQVQVLQSVEPQEEKLSVADDGAYKLIIRQEPAHARVAIGKDKDRKPIDPPPIVQLKVSPAVDPLGAYLQSPYLLMTCHLIADTDDKPSPPTSSLSGSLVSSIHKLKDADNTDGGFFIWGDLSAKVEGQYRLQFTLFELRFPEMVYLTYVVSKPFIVHPPKTFPGMSESTFLTRSFSDQGVRLRLRKDSRSMTNRKRNAAAAAEHHSGHMRLRAQEEEHRRRSQQMAAMRQNSYAETMSPIDGPGSHHRQPFGGPPGAPTGLGMYGAPPPDPRRDMPPLGPYGHHAAPGSHGHHAAASSHHYGGTSDPVVKRQRTSGGGDDSPAQWASDLPQYPTPTSVDDGSARRPESATHGQGGTWTPTMPYTTASPVFSLPPTTAPSPGMHGGATALPAPSPGGMAPHHAHQQHPHAHHQQPPHAGMPGMPSASPTMSPHHHAGPPAPQGSNGVMAAAGGPYNPYGAMPQPSPYGQHDARRMPAPGEIPPNFNF